MAIRDRLEKKTRRFGKGIRPPSKPLGARANRFADFVGEYFYPLINGIDMPREHLDLQVSMPSMPSLPIDIGAGSGACVSPPDARRF